MYPNVLLEMVPVVEERRHFDHFPSVGTTTRLHAKEPMQHRRITAVSEAHITQPWHRVMLAAGWNDAIADSRWMTSQATRRNMPLSGHIVLSICIARARTSRLVYRCKGLINGGYRQRCTRWLYLAALLMLVEGLVDHLTPEALRATTTEQTSESP